jgi:hypothetical protein
MLTTTVLLNSRLLNQQVATQRFHDAGQVVSWMGAMQAQDYTASKWAIGLRLPDSCDADIEQAISNRKIIRTWALRGTLHFLSPDDIHWILALIRPRLSSIYASYYRNLGLTDAVIKKSETIMRKILQNGNQLTRNEIAHALQGKKIETGEMRINFLLLRAALNGLICFGSRRGKQFTFTLLDEWISGGKEMKAGEALAQLAIRYFTSHGPATLQDFAWWSGLTLTDIGKAVKDAAHALVKETYDGREYFMATSARVEKTKPGVHLLPAFDEYLVGYKDRQHSLPEQYIRRVIGINGIFFPIIIVNGKIAGTWKRKTSGTAVTIEKAMLVPVSKLNETKILRAEKSIEAFYRPVN